MRDKPTVALSGIYHASVVYATEYHAREHYVMGAESARIFNPIMPRIPMIIASNIVTLLEGFHQTSSSIFLLYSKWPFKIPA